MKRRVLSLALVVFMLLSLMPVSVMAEGETSGTYTDDNGITYTLDNGVLTVSGDGECGRDWQSYLGGNSVTEVVIEDGITSIGNGAFYYCTALTSITIPDGVTSIGSQAFDCCNSLASIAIPDSVTSIGRAAFSDTAYYNDEANWENDVLYIDDYLIAGKNYLSGDYVIKDGACVIADSAFYGSSLTSITIPDSVTSICDCAFSYCSSLVNIIIPSSVTSIGEGAFSCCGLLMSVTFSDGVRVSATRLSTTALR